MSFTRNHLAEWIVSALDNELDDDSGARLRVRQEGSNVLVVDATTGEPDTQHYDPLTDTVTGTPATDDYGHVAFRLTIEPAPPW